MQHGSSPRVRGTDDNERSKPYGRRFIPACAGNSDESDDESGSQPVHPRVCGEQCQGDAHCKNNSGSSPRVRGTDQKVNYWHRAGRFIPACAGNSSSCCEVQSLKLMTVHPRVCGEQQVFKGGRPFHRGPVHPRVCGEQIVRTGLTSMPSRRRFIPACAGNRSLRA